MLVEFRRSGPFAFSAPNGKRLRQHLPVRDGLETIGQVQARFIEISSAAPAMRELDIPETVAFKAAPQQGAQLIGTLAFAEGLVGDILAGPRDQHARLQRKNIPVVAPEQPADSQLGRREAAGAVITVGADLFDGLPSRTADQGNPVSQAVLAVKGDLILVEIALIAAFAPIIPEPVGPVVKRSGDEQSLALALRPGPGLDRGRRKYGEAKRKP